MRPNKAKRLFVGSFLVVMLLAIVGPPVANAQGRNRNRGRHRPPRVIVYRNYNPFWYRYYDPFYDPFYRRQVVIDPIAYQREKGFKEGKDEGEEDAEKGRPANPTGHKDYVKSSSITFREAFVRGYDVGYREEMAEIREKARERRGE